MNIIYYDVCCKLKCVSTLPPCRHSYIEALTPEVTIFGDATFKEVIKVR